MHTALAFIDLIVDLWSVWSAGRCARFSAGAEGGSLEVRVLLHVSGNAKHFNGPSGDLNELDSCYFVCRYSALPPFGLSERPRETARRYE